MWKKALRNGGALVCGIVMSNITDATVPLYSKDWFRHVFISSVTVFIITELTYMKNWLGNGNGGSNGSINQSGSNSGPSAGH